VVLALEGASAHLKLSCIKDQWVRIRRALDLRKSAVRAGSSAGSMMDLPLDRLLRAGEFDENPVREKFGI